MVTNFEREIRQQPQVLRDLVRDRKKDIEDFAGDLAKNPPRFILIAARGTSDNAAIYAKYLLGALNRTPVGLGMPSLYTLYHQPPDMTGGLVMGISQSGQTPDVLAVLEEARRQGVPTISITNAVDSPIAKAADFSIDLGAGVERSVPASKTYTAQLAAIALLAASWRKDRALLAYLDRLEEYAERMLDHHAKLQEVAVRFGAKNHLVVVGRGYNYCTTFEIALKVKELSYMVAQAYSAADFRHGPIAVLEPGFPTVAVLPRGGALEDMQSLLPEMEATGADLVVFSNQTDLAGEERTLISLPEDLPEVLSPIMAVIPGQLLALELAVVRGEDPDAPRGLQKITMTY